MSLLRHRQDSYAFHDLTVMEICEQIFGFYSKGVIQPQWRWALEDPGIYRKRSLTTQYQESDLAFVQRLLAEEGIAYHFEHLGDAQAPNLGSHTLVLTDSNRKLAPNAPVSVRFHRSDVTEAEDSVQQWAEEQRWMVGQVQRQSWDYRSHSLLSGHAQGDTGINGCVDQDTAGPYAWTDTAQGEQRALQHLNAQQVARRQVHSLGTWRRLAPGATLCLSNHDSVQADEPMLCIRVRHQARNNLDAQMQAAVLAGLGPVPDQPEAVYTAPPSADTLNWEGRIYDDGEGGTYEVEQPIELPLDDVVATELPIWGNSRWSIVEAAKQLVLFETPIVHFLVRAFLEEGVDELLAHITTIEAALGLQADYHKNLRGAPDCHKNMSSTKRMRSRIAGLLGGRHFADQYEKLFEVRSAFLHGRVMNNISTNERVIARSLTREVVVALILATQSAPFHPVRSFLMVSSIRGYF